MNTAASATYTVTQGGFVFQVNWTNDPFHTEFVDFQDNPVTSLNFGEQIFASTPASVTVSCYLRRVAKAGTAVVGIEDSGIGASQIQTYGDLNTNPRMLVHVTVSVNREGAYYGVMRATGSLNEVVIQGSFRYEAPDAEPSAPAQQVYGYVTTPQGRFLTSDPNLVGRYVENPTSKRTVEVKLRVLRPGMRPE